MGLDRKEQAVEKSQQVMLVEELVSSRDFLLRQLEDLAEQEGRLSDKLAWAWIRKFQKFPSKRNPPRGKTNGSWVETPGKGRVWTVLPWWGWSFNGPGGNEYYLHGPLESLEHAEQRGPTALPKCLLDMGYMKSTPYKTCESAILVAVRAMGRLLKWVEEQQKPGAST